MNAQEEWEKFPILSFGLVGWCVRLFLMPTSNPSNPVARVAAAATVTSRHLNSAGRKPPASLEEPLSREGKETPF